MKLTKEAMCKKCTLQIQIIDGNKRNGAYAFVWFLKKARVLNLTTMTPVALTASTLLIAESEPKNKEMVIRLILQLLRK